MEDPNKKPASMKETWSFLLQVLLRAALIFVLLNLLFALLDPLDQLGRVSIYNWLAPGRERLPYGERPDEDYNISLNNIPAMFASHEITKPKEMDEFRVVVLGDSGTWGWLLENSDTLTGQLNSKSLQAADGRDIVFYNLAYPVMSATKDLLLLSSAMEMEPDLILWPITLQSLNREKQLDHPLLRNNQGEIRRLIEEYNLALYPDDQRFADLNYLEKTIVGRRRDLADLIRLQLYAPAWAATGIDQARPEEISLRSSDFDVDLSWGEIGQPTPLTSDQLTWEVIEAGIAIAGDTPIWIINEPIYISKGENSDLRYNAWYPRWAYDDYRQQLNSLAEDQEWQYIDMWNSIAPAEFTDSPVHLTILGTSGAADILAELLVRMKDEAQQTELDEG